MSDVCDRCGFDRSEWNEQDAERTLSHAAGFLAAWSTDAPAGLARRLDARTADVLGAIDASAELIDRTHHLWHGLVSIADQRRVAGDALPTATGTVDGLHRSDGGVPKLPVDDAQVGVRGVEGDRQAARVHHGRPWQALCLWSSDAIAAFVAEGHPIAPGSAGENVTIGGLDWASLRAGTILDIGDVRCQLWSPAEPCQKNARWFTDGDVGRMHVDRDPGRTRWYASVLRPGVVRVGDTVTVSP
ncbi:MAG: MOSC domain-containing protein [Actinomycetota bacterium]